MSLTRLIYASRMAKGVDPGDLMRILEASKRNNEKLAVTGVLCYSSAGFLQVIEGPSDSVNELFRRIVRDTRNENVTLLWFDAVAKRDFPEWAMAYIRSDEVDGPILKKFTDGPVFDPFSLTAKQAHEFLLHTAAHRRRFLMEKEKEARASGHAGP